MFYYEKNVVGNEKQNRVEASTKLWVYALVRYEYFKWQTEKD